MIAAIVNGFPVQVEGTHLTTVVVISLGRQNIDSHYVGGIGYTGCKTAFVSQTALEAVAQFDPDNCEEYQNWLEAMRETDALADDRSSNTQAALDIEEEARLKFNQFIHAHSIAPGSHQNEITPEVPQIPAFQFWEGDYAEDLYSAGLALQGSRGA